MIAQRISTAGIGLLAAILTGCFSPSSEAVGTAAPAPGIPGSSPNAKVNAFFDMGPTAAEIKLPADQVFPRGRVFPFAYYSIGGGSEAKRGELLPEAEKRADQKEIMEAGTTLIGPQYELNGEAVALAREYRRQTVYTIIPEVDGAKLVGSRAFDKYNAANPLPREKIAASIAAQVKAVADNPEIAWWDITPEELRYWRPVEVEYLKLATDTIRANDPLQRPIMMYEPGHRDANSLTKLTPCLDFIAKGMYTNYSSKGDERVWTRYSTQEAVKARELLKRPEIAILALPEMFVEPKTAAERAMIPVWVRHDVYSALTAGAQGVLVFSASKRPNFSSRPIYLDAYKTVASELTGKLDLGTVFLFGKRMDDLEFQNISGPETVKLTMKNGDLTLPATAMANIAFNRLRYVILVNSSPETVTGMVSGLPYGNDVTVRDLWSDRPAWSAPEGEFEVELPPWGVRAFVLGRGQ